MHELYAFPNSYALGAHLLLEECGVPYRVVDVRDSGALDTTKNAAQGTPAAKFKAVSPHQRVPALKLPGGGTLFESGAIALYLADTLCKGKFAIDTDSDARPEYLQWLFYLSSTLQPEVMLQFHPEYYFSDADRQDALQRASNQRLTEIWSVLEARYTSGPWMFENRPTAVDFALVNVLLWSECFPTDGKIWPNLTRTLLHIKERPTCQPVLRWHWQESTQTGNPAHST